MNDHPDQRPPAGWEQQDQALVAVFTPASFSVGADFVRQIAEVAVEINHHPELTLEYGKLTARLFSHDADNTVTKRDIRLAHRIEELAEQTGIPRYSAES